MHGEAAHLELLNLLLMLTGAVLMPLVSARVHLPSAVLLIFFGILLGPHGLGILHLDKVGGFFSDVGFLILMFMAGLEIDFNEIRQKGTGLLVLITMVSLTVFGLAFLAAWLLAFPPIFGLALGATSVGLPMAVLKESNKVGSKLGQTVLLMGSVGELLTVLAMTLYYFLVRYGFSLDLAIGIGKLFGLLVLAGIFLRILLALAWWNPERFEKLVSQQDGSEIGVRSALFLAIGFSTLAVLAGVEGIVGAFVAGAVMAFVLRGMHVLENKLSVVGQGLFIPIFFIWVGMEFSPELLSVPVLIDVGIFLLIAFTIRLLPSLSLMLHGFAFRELAGTSSLLSAPLTLVVAIAAIGTSLKTLDENSGGLLVTMAITAGVVFPVLFKVLDRKSDHQDQV